MGIETIPGEGELLFDAELRPNRSLSVQGFRILMAVVCLFSLVVGLAFYLQGAWPVLGFLGLDVVAFYLAFRLSFRSGRLTETVRLSQDELSIHRIQPSGRRRQWSFQPYWARVSLESDETDAPDAADASGGPSDGIGSHGSILVTSHGRGVRLGRFLAPEERRSFADALGLALRRLGHH
ncbi:MAG: DUF2244 domain-containing protein [Alphaproteobacteria bacterium]|nr:DUF2244 domain-containing protein [Alphaproteobacteria bacterium]